MTVLLATLRDASKKQAKERALDVEEAAEKGSSVENGSSAVATFRLCSLLSRRVDFECPQVPTGSHQLRSANRPRAIMHVHTSVM